MSCPDEKMMKVEVARTHVKDAESRFREAQHACEIGTQRQDALVQQAISDRAREIDRLREEVVRACNAMEREQALLRLAEANLERGFDA